MLEETPHRKKLRRYEVANQPRFLTWSCYQRLPLFRNDRIKDAFVRRIDLARTQTRFKLLAWVIMPEHVHLVIVPALPDFPVTTIVRALKQKFARSIIHRWSELNAPILKRIQHEEGKYRFWQRGGGYDRNLSDEDELWGKVEYIHKNPLMRALVQHPTEYPWSSAQWYSGHRDNTLSIDVP